MTGMISAKWTAFAMLASILCGHGASLATATSALKQTMGRRGN
jgi:hypothetical protein